jgi:hypothetical protein
LADREPEIPVELVAHTILTMAAERHRAAPVASDRTPASEHSTCAEAQSLP